MLASLFGQMNLLQRMAMSAYADKFVCRRVRVLPTQVGMAVSGRNFSCPAICPGKAANRMVCPREYGVQISRWRGCYFATSDTATIHSKSCACYSHHYSKHNNVIEESRGCLIQIATATMKGSNRSCCLS
jgi:hypothetical protein